jgi:hypothetical protein
MFYLKKFILAKLNYNIYNKELLAIVVVFKIYKVYLEEA